MKIGLTTEQIEHLQNGESVEVTPVFDRNETYVIEPAGADSLHEYQNNPDIKTEN
jgi:hypothetical protein